MLLGKHRTKWQSGNLEQVPWIWVKHWWSCKCCQGWEAEGSCAWGMWSQCWQTNCSGQFYFDNKYNLSFLCQSWVISSNLFQVIDRYRFMTLLPLSGEELRSIGYQSIATAPATVRPSFSLPATQGTQPVTNGHHGLSSTTTSDPDHIVRPDYSQMVPFKPKVLFLRNKFVYIIYILLF